MLGNLRRMNRVNTYSFMSWGVEESFSATFLIQVAATGPMAESSEEATLSCCGLWMTTRLMTYVRTRDGCYRTMLKRKSYHILRHPSEA